MQFLLGDTHKGGNSFHVSLDTIRVGGTFHQQFSRTEQRSNLRRNNNTSLSVIISFNSYVVLYILVHEDMNLK